MAYISFNGAPAPVTNPWTISGSVSLGDVVYQVAGADRTVARAKADDAAKVPPLGVVTGVSGSTVQVAGNGETAAGFSGLSAGTVYWLDTVAGQMTTTKPASNIYLVGVATSAQTLLVGFTAAELPSGAGGSGTVSSVGFTSNNGSLAIGGDTTITGSGTATVNLATVPIARGGTGQTDKTAAFDALAPTATKGSMAYTSATNTYNQWTVGATNQALRQQTNALGWTSTLPGDVTSVAIQNTDGYITVTGSPITTSGTISLALQTVPVSKGGTGLTSFAEEGALLYGNASGGYTSQNVPQYMRNRIINGDMKIAQRGTAAVTTTGGYPVDRWFTNNSTSASFSIASSSTVPSGFTNSLAYTVVAPASATAAQVVSLNQIIEGSNIYDLAWGTGTAKSITLSFWVRSSLTGTYCVSLRNSASNRSYVATYTISSANTYERKSITIPGDTTGDWLTTSGVGIRLWFDLGSGSDVQTTEGSWQFGTFTRTASQANLIGTAGATFYLTGVQLELGTVATPYEPRPIQTELALCQRYYARLQSLSGTAVGFGAGVVTVGASNLAPSTHSVYVKYPVTMRTYPTMAISSCSMQGSSARPATLGAVQYGLDSCQATVSSTGQALQTYFTTGNGSVLVGNTSTSYVEFNAEL